MSFVEQRDLGLPHPSGVTNHGGRLGVLLGVANTAFVAIAFSGIVDGEKPQAMVFFASMIFLLGIVPGVVTGLFLGGVAEALARRRTLVRRAALVIPANAVMIGYSAIFGAAAVFALGVIPTTVCALILERYTRARPELPVATLR